jgi:hypothetical protein
MEIKIVNSNSSELFVQKLESLIDSGYKPSLAIIFCSVEIDIEVISKVGLKYDFSIFGISSSGEIANDEIFESSVVGMFFNISPELFYLKAESTHSKNIFDITNDLKSELNSKFKNRSFIVSASGISTDGEEVVESMLNIFGEDIPLFGGLAGDDLHMKETFVFTHNGIFDNGIAYLVFNNDFIELKGIATSGWEAIGVEKVVTKAKGNIIYEIDYEPAVDVFIKYFNVEVDLDTSSDVVENIGVKYPLQVIREGRKPVLRAPLYANAEDKSLVFAGRIQEGAKVKFSVPPTFEIIDTTISNIEKLREEFPVAEGMIMFSCAARKLALGPMTEDEIQGIRSIWKVPLVGIFTYGEIGNAQNNISDFHNETCSVVLFKSKD